MSCEQTERIYFHKKDPEHEMPTARLGGGQCPFRGQVRHEGELIAFPLDERCPTTLPAVQVRARHTHRLFSIHDPEELEEPIGWTGEPPIDIPVMKADSYCKTCVYGMVREQEAGMNVRPMREPSSSTRSNRLVRRGPSKRKLARKLARQLRGQGKK